MLAWPAYACNEFTSVSGALGKDPFNCAMTHRLSRESRGVFRRTGNASKVRWLPRDNLVWRARLHDVDGVEIARGVRQILPALVRRCLRLEAQQRERSNGPIQDAPKYKAKAQLSGRWQLALLSRDLGERLDQFHFQLPVPAN
jgi:hypothetical protein